MNKLYVLSDTYHFCEAFDSLDDDQEDRQRPLLRRQVSCGPFKSVPFSQKLTNPSWEFAGPIDRLSVGLMRAREDPRAALEKIRKRASKLLHGELEAFFLYIPDNSFHDDLKRWTEVQQARFEDSLEDWSETFDVLRPEEVPAQLPVSQKQHHIEYRRPIILLVEESAAFLLG